MVRKQYTEEQIIAVLKEGEVGARVADLCRKYGMRMLHYSSLRPASHSIGCPDSHRGRIFIST